MKHPLHKLGRKNRNIIAGLMVGIASLFTIAYYLDLPGGLLLRHFLTTVLFVVIIMVLAIAATLVFKLITRALSGFLERKFDNQDDDDSGPGRG